MEIKELEIPGVYKITLAPIMDDRGFFMRAYDLNTLNQFGLNRVWVQENHSRSEQKGVIRGLHFQLPPFSETKLIRCVKGSILDVIVDIRQNSETFGKWISIELSEINKQMLYIPRGFAHGFCTLTEVSEVIYKADNFYSKEFERGILWNDPDLGINWPLVEKPVLSEKDSKNLSFKEFKEKHIGLNV